MKKKRSRIFIFVISFILILINTFFLNNHDRENTAQVNAQIAKPVVVIENDEMLKEKIKETSFPMEYHFWIHNFEEEAINEVEFAYTIELKKSVDNFPVNLRLIDVSSQQEIFLRDGKSEILKLAKGEKESREFKLILEWKELDEQLAENLQIQLKINAVQSKGGMENAKNQSGIIGNAYFSNI